MNSANSEAVRLVVRPLRVCKNNENCWSAGPRLASFCTTRLSHVRRQRLYSGGTLEISTVRCARSAQHRPTASFRERFGKRSVTSVAVALQNPPANPTWERLEKKPGTLFDAIPASYQAGRQQDAKWAFPERQMARLRATERQCLDTRLKYSLVSDTTDPTSHFHGGVHCFGWHAWETKNHPCQTPSHRSRP